MSRVEFTRFFTRIFARILLVFLFKNCSYLARIFKKMSSYEEFGTLCQGSFYVIFINETCAISGRCVKGTALIETRQGMMRRWRKNGGRKRTRRRPCWIYSVNDFQMCGDFNNMSQTQAKTTFRSQKLAPGKLLVPLRMKKMIKNEAHFTSVLHDFSEASVTGSSATSKLCARCFSKH